MNIIKMERKTGDYGFEAIDENDNTLHTDSSIENGGSNYGFRPMQMILASLGSCSAIDIVSILKKQKQTVEDIKIRIEGEREQKVIPSLWKSVNIFFEIHGNIDEEKVRKATALSMDKHCSVAETLRRGGTHITWHLNVINSKTAVAQ
jgi:putative redox protein